MPRFRTSALVPVLVATFWFPAIAPAAPVQRPVEIGFDFGLELLQFEGETAWDVSIPGGGGFYSYQTGFRVGFPVSDAVRIEPAIGFSYLSEEDVSFYNLRLIPSVVADVGGRADGPKYFVKAGAGVRVVGGDIDSEAQFLAGGGFGIRTPIAQRLAQRVELTYTRAFESGEFQALNLFDLKIGFSFLAGGTEP